MRKKVWIVSLGLAAGCSDAGLGPSATTEEGFFLSGSTRLSYALDIPVEGTAPHPAVVLGHDSGPNTKNDLKRFARPLVEEGIAVLRFDKRGVGDSEGVYERGKADFDLLSGDLVAAVDLVSNDARIDAARIGLMGNSQAGWILPIVATRSEHVSFTIMLSGPTVTVGQHNYWDSIADEEQLSIDELSAMLADFVPQSGDFDPRPFLEEMVVPGLWLLGERDRIIPARESAAIIDEIVNELGKPFTVVIYPNGDHGLRDVDNGDPIPYWDDLFPWFDRNIR